MRPRTVPSLVFSSVLTLPAAVLGQTNNKGVWGSPEARYATAYPDINAVYWLFHFKVPSSKTLSFRLTGDFPHARYFGLSIYDLDTTNVQGALLDADIKPDAGSKNPFSPGVNRSSKPRRFTVWVVPAGSPNAKKPNTLRIGAKVKTGTLMMRVYRPDKGRGLSGGVALPVIEAIDDKTGKPVASTSFHVSRQVSSAKIGAAFYGAFARFRQTLLASVDKRISFFHFDFNAGFPNGDANYMATGLRPATTDPVAVIRFRPPTTPHTYGGGGAFSGKEQMRYWSINVAIDKWTQVLDGKNDEYLKPDRHGLTTIVFGPVSIRAAVEKAGFAFLPNGPQFGALSLWYRHMVPNKSFAPRMQDVPLFDPTKPIDAQRGERYMGEYAPTGRYYSVSGFLAALKKGEFASRFANYGRGCAGGKGVPTLTSSGGLPSLGNPHYALQTRGMPAGAPGLLVHGGSSAAWAGSKLPLDLSSLGAKGCWLQTSYDVLRPFRADATGVASVPMPVPNLAWLIGVPIYHQAFVTDLAAKNVNRISATSGGRSILAR